MLTMCGFFVTPSTFTRPCFETVAGESCLNLVGFFYYSFLVAGHIFCMELLCV